MNIQIAKCMHDSIVDGPGLRYVVFAQGCPHRCAGCQNPQTHDFDGGKPVSPDDIEADMRKNPLLRGLTLSGGEPFCQADALAELARRARRMGLDVWCYTGYVWSELWGHPGHEVLLSELDVLVDGPYIAAQRSYSLSFRGSANQRLIDVPASLRKREMVLWTP